MRDIKFRIWDNDNMIYPDQKYNFINAVFWNIKTTSAKEIKLNTLNEQSLMQFTGLTDKNGKEIYEGDLVRWGCGFTGSYDSENWHRHAIVELFPALQFRIFRYYDSKENKFKDGDNHIFGYANFIYKKTDLYFEVIGNIHEHPELLNQK